MTETQQKALELAERVDALLAQAQDLFAQAEPPSRYALAAGNYLALAACELRSVAEGHA